ncbi:MAG: HAMP domain-containing histidine kinase [Deltaproteobacteria bacterium]|nr:HAMP domain-containing histidine kinase [Deltaproteobacteria bacterium]
MKITIFSRLAIGYIIILSMVVFSSIYELYQLSKVNEVTRSVLEIDNRILDLQKKLTDSLLSLMRYEKKYIVLEDDSLHERFLLATADFKKDLQRTFSLKISPEVQQILKRVERFHAMYHSLVVEEFQNIKNKKSYDTKRYDLEKEDTINKVFDDLKKLEEFSRRDTYNKIKQLDIAVTDSYSVALVIIAATLLAGAVISVIITGNITRPLSVMKRKTHEIAKGHFDISLQHSSLPEMNELADAFNVMCMRLKQVDKMKSDFLSVMSHELRTPLASIQEGTNMMLEGIGGKITERQEKLLTIIAEEDKRLINLVNSILDLSKMEAGMMKYNFEQGDLIPLLRRTLIEITPIVKAKHIKFKGNFSDELPLVEMDREMITRVLRNLLGNAIKFTPNGGIIDVTVRRQDGWIEASISDTGPGIPEEDFETIFDKYKQVEFPGSDKKKGTGLGLSIVKHILTAHGGKVWVTSTLGAGSTFTFALPF